MHTSNSHYMNKLGWILFLCRFSHPLKLSKFPFAEFLLHDFIWALFPYPCRNKRSFGLTSHDSPGHLQQLCAIWLLPNPVAECLPYKLLARVCALLPVIDDGVSELDRKANINLLIPWGAEGKMIPKESAVSSPSRSPVLSPISTEGIPWNRLKEKLAVGISHPDPLSLCLFFY